LRGRLDRAALQKALDTIVTRHEALRARFEAEDGNPVQIITGPGTVELPVIDLARFPESHREEETQRLLEEEARRAFDLSHGSLLRATLLRLGEMEHVL
jgi:hypothetical protein